MRTLSQSSAVYWQRTASLDWGDGGGKATNDRRADDKKETGAEAVLTRKQNRLWVHHQTLFLEMDRRP